MGNLAEAGGFGDTRIPSDNEEDENCNYGVSRAVINSENIDPSQYTYRNGVNYKRALRKESEFEEGNSNALNNVWKSNVPRSIEQRYMQ